MRQTVAAVALVAAAMLAGHAMHAAPQYVTRTELNQALKQYVSRTDVKRLFFIDGGSYFICAESAWLQTAGSEKSIPTWVCSEGPVGSS